MPYSYYLVYTHETNKKDTGTNVYAADEQQAKDIGAVLLSRITGKNITSDKVFADEEPTIQEDDITTT
jgi:hypothetical protein|nr:MAG TPA: hypothetical protein [Caudoviricetes sp.]